MAIFHMNRWQNTQPEQPASVWRACHGPCEQGRKLCPCPDACQRMAAEVEAEREPRNALSLWQYLRAFFAALRG